MPKKPLDAPAEAPQDAALEPFFFPGIHGGVVIHARDSAEAQEKAAKLRADVSPSLPS